MGLREDIREDTASTVSNIVAMAVHAKEKEYAAIQDNVTDCIVRLERIEAKLSGEPVKISLEDCGRWLNHLRHHEKIEAIKEVRNLTGCGLKEAKDFVEFWENLIRKEDF